jgi:hypothetical protein
MLERKPPVKAYDLQPDFSGKGDDQSSFGDGIHSSRILSF